MSQKKALIGMSGGVDSSVAAWLMLQAGWDCTGATMQLFDKCALSPKQHDHPADEIEDARRVACKLNIPFYVLDFQDTFREEVMENFVQCYEQGLTPNPCIVCNRRLKFGVFLQQAQLLGCDAVVTGHYANIRYQPDSGRYLLYKATNTAKDQSYFLYSLTQAQLAHIQFPLGGMSKEEVRQIAQQMDFDNAKKQDSQDICFVPDGDYVAFLRKYTGKDYAPGNYLDLSGKIVGTHSGAVGYTLGQRKGLGLAMGTPVYVCDKDMQANTVTVGPNEALMRTALRATDVNWIAFDSLTQPIHVNAKTRSRMTEQPATVYPEKNGNIRVEFDCPQRAITPGQAVVLYDGDLVVGGGTITEVL